MNILDAIKHYFDQNCMSPSIIDNRCIYINLSHIDVTMHVLVCDWDSLYSCDCYLERLITLMTSRNIRYGKTMVRLTTAAFNFTAAENCVIYYAPNLCAGMVSCVYADQTSPLIELLDYKILYDCGVNQEVRAKKIYAHRGLQNTCRYIDVNCVFVECISTDTFNIAIENNIPCIITPNVIIINKSHYLYSDIIAYMREHALIYAGQNLSAWPFIETFACANIVNGYELFLDIELEAKLIKNAYNI
jgi:hypothetical protein